MDEKKEIRRKRKEKKKDRKKEEKRDRRKRRQTQLFKIRHWSPWKATWTDRRAYCHTNRPTDGQSKVESLSTQLKKV